jgi:uncharacterized membrane protein
MKKHLNIFLAGVVVLAPFAVTAWVIYWAVIKLDGLVGGVVIKTMGFSSKPEWLFPGAGAIVALVLIYVIGLLTRLYAFRLFMGTLERLFLHVPVIKSLFESIRDIIRLFSGGGQNIGQVVRCHLPGSQTTMLGILTNRNPRATAGQNKVAVYLPMSYQLGGFTVYLDPDCVEPVEGMTVQEALKTVATAEAAPETAAKSGAAVSRRREGGSAA